MKKIVVAALILSWVLWGCATTSEVEIVPQTDEKCEVPIWNKGDYWRFMYDDKREWQYTVESTDGNFYVVEDRYGMNKPCFDKKTLALVSYIKSDGSKLKPSNPSIFYCEFPLYVGKKWKKSYTTIPDRGQLAVNYLNEYRIMSYEDISVPAGTFKAFKVEMNQTNYAGGSGKAYIWYSPGARFVVKVSFEKINYWTYSQGFQLISFQVKK